jgi:CubicO group peptidase (beta-lactamase class C family)
MGLLARAVLGVAIAALLQALLIGLSWPQPRSAAWRWIPCRGLGVLCAPYVVSGECEREQAVRQTFERNFATMEETSNGAMLAVLRGAEQTCELYGHFEAGRVVDANSLQVCFSTSKVVASLACAMLVDRGVLEYDARIASYWPEFAGGGKGEITIRELMQHRAGLAWLSDGDPTTDDSLPLFEPGAEDYMARIARVIERSNSTFAPGSKTGYHGLTRDVVLSQIVYRVTNKTLGKFIQDEIAGPLGIEVTLLFPFRLLSLICSV